MNVDWERWGRAAGAAFVVLTIAAFVVGGEPPTVSDPVEDVISYFDGDRSQVLVSSLLFALALGFFIWFGATLANSLRERAEGRVGATILAATTAFATIQFVTTAFNAVLAYSVAGNGEPGVAKALFDLTWVLDIMAAVPSMVFFLAVAMGFLRTGLTPRWLAFAALGIAVLFALRTTNWANDGFWSPTGEYLFILIPLTLIWILVTSVVLLRATPESPTSAERVLPTVSEP